MSPEIALPQGAEFQLLETILIEAGTAFLRERHVGRLLATARFFDFPCDAAKIEHVLDAAEREHPHGRHKLRILHRRSGRIETHSAPLEWQAGRRQFAALATHPVDPDDPFLRHKTTHRPVYDEALAQHPSADDVILWNENGWLTESCRANVVVRVGGRLLTPPEECGLLPGTYRAELLAADRIREERIDCEMLVNAEAVFLVNSVRRWIPIDLDGQPSESIDRNDNEHGKRRSSRVNLTNQG